MNGMRTVEKSNCLVCSAEGEELYLNQTDKLFGTSGNWNIFKCSNDKCRLLWLNPMPTEEDIGQAYRSYYTHDTNVESSNSLAVKAKTLIKECYFALRFGYMNHVTKNAGVRKLLGLVMYLFPAKRSEADFSIMHVPFIENGSLLEIGCGNGAMLSVMKDLGWKVEGVEVDPAGVEVARARGLPVHLGDVYSRCYRDNSFDAITLSHVIEHVHDPIGLIRECARIVKPGGKISIVTPNSFSLGHSIFKSSWLHLDPPRHLHIFNNAIVEKISVSLGLKVEISRTIIRDADTLFIASNSIKRSGSYVWGSDLDAGKMIKVGAKILQLIEWLLLKGNPFIGEEVLLVVSKKIANEPK